MPLNIELAQNEVQVFQPLTITISSKASLATLLGILAAYGTAKVYAENSLKAIGLGDFYNGNVRKSARELALGIAEAAESANVDLDGLEGLVQSYLQSHKFRGSRISKAGAAVAGTSEDNSNGRSVSTTFETE